MRYFRYKNTDKNLNNALKAQYKSLTDDEKRTFHREKRWRNFSTVVTVAVYFFCLVAGIFLLKAIPQQNTWFLKLLIVICKVVIGLILLVISGVVTFGLTMPLWRKVDSFRIPAMKKEIFTKACGHLRNFYGLQEPYIITKCFDATDKKFVNHDVCIFIAEDELRLTTDLVRGFLHGERDLGCYAFKQAEITLSKQKNGNHLVAELRADNVVFLLGYRAKGFIDKNFITRQ